MPIKTVLIVYTFFGDKSFMKLVELYKALTMLEVVIALSVMAVVFVAILPQLTNINNSWDSKRAGAEILQSGRVLMDHLNRHLASAVRITSVSEQTETNGCIEFRDIDGNIFRYDIGDDGYIRYGQIGNMADLAGPVSRMQLTCYDLFDLDTPIMNVDKIRCIHVQTTFPNASALGRDVNFDTKIYLRTNAIRELAYWPLNEGSGLVAEDFAGDNDGTLCNGPTWSSLGAIGGAVLLDGVDDYIEVPPLNINKNTVTISAWVHRMGTQPVFAGIFFSRLGDTIAGVHLSVTNEIRYTWNNDPDTWLWSSGLVVPGSDWFFIAMVVEPDKATLYLEDGSMNSKTNNVNHDIEEFNGNSWIGRDYDASWGTNDRYFNGMIDDVRVYDFALAPEQIQQLFDCGEVILP